LTAPTTPSPSPKTNPDDIMAILERGNRGDASVLPQLNKVLDEHPEVARLMGNVVNYAEQALLTLVAGTSLTAREAISRELSALRSRLTATAKTELERLVSDRICLSWIAVSHAEVGLAELLQKHPGYSRVVRAAERHLDRANVRFLASIRALANLQTKGRPPLSPLDLVRGTVKETPAEKGRREARRRAKTGEVAVTN